MNKKHQISTAFTVVLIVLITWWGFNNSKPDLHVSKQTIQNFSISNALLHVKAIAEKPHFVGTDAHREVRKYLLNELESMGLQPHVQAKMVVGKKYRNATFVRNIICRIKGSEKGKALLLLSHYDSEIHASPGASDAGSGVAVILEGIRAFLDAKQSPKNDIIILISDAEELGLLGAQAFVDHHPWSKDVGLVLNFEARGSGGPSYMFMETNGGNQQLIASYKEAYPYYTNANSLLYSLYKLLPNDTDLTAFRKYGDINGFNFAFIDDHFDYHTSQDSFDRLDQRSLMHQATYLMPLLSHFSQADLDNLNSEDDHVFFSIPGITMIDYPFSFGPILFVLVIIFFIAALFLLHRKSALNLKSIFKGVALMILLLIGIGVIGFYGWKLIEWLYPSYTDINHGFTYNGHYYIAAFVSLALWLTIAVYGRYGRSLALTDLSTGPIILWLILSFAALKYLPGAGYFVLIPMLAICMLLSREYLKEKPEIALPVAALFSIPVLLIFTPFVPLFSVGLGLKMLAVSAILTSLLIMAILPMVKEIHGFRQLNRIFAVTAVVFLLSAHFSADFSSENKKPNSLSLFQLAEENKNYWITYDKNLDSYTKQFLGTPQYGKPEGSPDHYVFNGIHWHQEAKNIHIPEPTIEILKDSLADNKRQVHLKIHSNREAHQLVLRSLNDLEIHELRINGVNARQKENDMIRLRPYSYLVGYFVTAGNTNLELEMTVSNNDQISLMLYDIAYDLTHSQLKKITNSAINPRSDTQMEKAFVINDATLVKKEIHF